VGEGDDLDLAQDSGLDRTTACFGRCGPIGFPTTRLDLRPAGTAGGRDDQTRMTFEKFPQSKGVGADRGAAETLARLAHGLALFGT
jgi:hypothetical protein